jgi:hypothetical protein
VLCDSGVPLLRLADRILGPPEGQSEPRKRWWLRYLSVATLVAVVIVIRRLDAVTTPQFWAEDGYIYFVENATLGFLRAFAKLYNGYPNLTQRCIAMLGGLVPVAQAPRVYTSSAIALTALSVASFSLPAWRHFVRCDALRVLFCVAAVCLPFDQEILSTPTNLGWLLAIWLSLVSVMRLPRAPWGMALLAGAASCVVFSTPLAPVNLPLWLLRAARGSARGDRRELGFALVLVAALAGVVVFTRSMGSTTSVTVPMGVVRVTFRSWVNLASFRVASLVVPSPAPADTGPAQMLLTAHLPLAYVVASLVVVGLLAASVVAHLRNMPALLVVLALASGSVALTLLGRSWLNLLAPQAIPMRYSVYPAAMLVLALVVALDGLSPELVRTGSTLAAIGLLARAWSSSFVIPPFQDLHWARYAPSLEHTLRDRCPVRITVPMNPPFAPLRITWGQLLPEKPVSPEQVVGIVAPKASFQQSFTSGCDRLTEVDLYLGTHTSSAPQALSLTILDGSASIASVTLTPTDPGTDGWQPFCLPPIDASNGRRLTLVLSAISTDRSARVVVFGGRTGEASLRNGCAA